MKKAAPPEPSGLRAAVSKRRSFSSRGLLALSPVHSAKSFSTLWSAVRGSRGAGQWCCPSPLLTVPVVILRQLEEVERPILERPFQCRAWP